MQEVISSPSLLGAIVLASGAIVAALLTAAGKVLAARVGRRPRRGLDSAPPVSHPRGMEPGGDNPGQPEAITLREAAERAGVSVQALRGRISRGALETVETVDPATGRTVTGVLVEALEALYPRAAGRQGETTARQPRGEEPAPAFGIAARYEEQLEDLRGEILFLRRVLVQRDAQLGELPRLLEGRRGAARSRTWPTILATGALGLATAGALWWALSASRDALAAERGRGDALEIAGRATVAAEHARDLAEGLEEEARRGRQEAQEAHAALEALWGQVAGQRALRAAWRLVGAVVALDGR